MRQLEKFSSWYSKFALAWLVAGPVIVFVAGRLILGVPLINLVLPWLVFSGFGVTFGPLMYFSLRYRLRSGGDTRYVFAIATAAAIAGSCLLYYYAWDFGLISRHSLRGLCITAVVAIPPIGLLAYYVERKLFPIK
jgi:hypothetical protein